MSITCREPPAVSTPCAERIAGLSNLAASTSGSTENTGIVSITSFHQAMTEILGRIRARVRRIYNMCKGRNGGSDGNGTESSRYQQRCRRE